MPLYTVHLFDASGTPVTLDAKAFPDDGAAFDYTERMLDRHGSCHHVDIWCILRPVEGPGRIAAHLVGHAAELRPVIPPP